MNIFNLFKSKSKKDCNHLFVGGFGGMGDAFTCCICGLSKYPEVIRIELTIASIKHRIINEDHPDYRSYVDLVNSPRLKKLRALRQVLVN